LVKGKPEKIPYSLMGYRASSTNPNTWSRLDSLLKILGQRPDFANGVSFVVTKTDPFCAIDLDDCLTDTGAAKPWVRSLLRVFHDCYQELTPSLAGLRIWFLAQLTSRLYEDLPDGRIEAYAYARHFTFTGLRYGDAPLELTDHQTDLDRLVAYFSSKRSSTRTDGRTARFGDGDGPKYDGPRYTGPGSHTNGFYARGDDASSGHARANRGNFSHPFRLADKLVKGERYNGFLSIAGTLAIRGACDAAVVGAIEGMNQEQCDPRKSSQDLAED
jgi:hypothetical protein